MVVLLVWDCCCLLRSEEEHNDDSRRVPVDVDDDVNNLLPADVENALMAETSVGRENEATKVIIVLRFNN